MNLSKFAAFGLGFVSVALVFALFYFFRFVAMPTAPAVDVIVCTAFVGSAVIFPAIVLAERLEKARPR